MATLFTKSHHTHIGINYDELVQLQSMTPANRMNNMLANTQNAIILLNRNITDEHLNDILSENSAFK
jgi:hypothetical protein